MTVNSSADDSHFFLQMTVISSADESSSDLTLVGNGSDKDSTGQPAEKKEKVDSVADLMKLLQTLVS